LPFLAVLFFFLIPSTAFAETITFTSVMDDWINVDTATRHSVARAFTPSSNATDIDINLYLFKYDSPTGNYVIELRTDSSNLPSATVLDSYSADITTLSTAYCTGEGNLVTASFSGLSLVASTKYWVVITRSVRTPGYLMVCNDAGTTSTLAYWTDNGTNWSQRTTIEITGNVVLTNIGGGSATSTATTTNNTILTDDAVNVYWTALMLSLGLLLLVRITKRFWFF